MTNVLVQYSHGVLTSENNPSVQHTQPLPSFNPKIEDLPANPLADPVVTEDTNLIGGGLPTDPASTAAPTGNLIGGGAANTEGADTKAADGNASTDSTDATTSDTTTTENASTDAAAATDATSTDATSTDAKATGTKAKTTSK